MFPLAKIAHPLRWPMSALGVIALALALSGCTFHSKDKVAEQKPVSPGTPNAINQLPPLVGEVSVDISNGAFSTGGIELLRQGGSTIHLVNHDATAYQFEIAPDLVKATAVAASTTTTISFTSTKAGDFTGHLLSATDGHVLASITVRIENAGAVNP